jgi:hypothetical protein
MSTTARKQPPSHEALLADLFELNFRIEDLIAKHELTPAQFLAFSEDETVRKTLDAFESLQTRHQRILARQHQAGAVGYLHQCIMDAPSTVETRRAATALARLTTIMLAPPRPLRARRASEGDPEQTQQPTPTPNPTNSTPSTTPTNTPTKTATTTTTPTSAVSSTTKPITSLEAPLPTPALVITTPALTSHPASTRTTPRTSG